MREYVSMDEIEEMGKLDIELAILYWARDRFNLRLSDKERIQGEAA